MAQLEMKNKLEKKSGFDKFLDGLERVCNKLPEPFMLFVWICLGIVVVSWILAILHVSAVHPVTNKTLTVVNLLSANGLQMLLANAVTNFSSFAPLGIVLVCMLGVGVCEKSGLLSVALRKGLANVKGSGTKVIVLIVVLSILSMAAGDSGFIIMPPLGAMIFSAIGRNPLAGMMCAYASVAGAFGGNFILSSLDVLLIGFTESAVKTSGMNVAVNPAMNYYFQLFSAFMVTVLATWVTIKYVEPRLGKIDKKNEEKVEDVTPVQAKALKYSGIALLVYFVIVVIGVVPANGLLRDPQTKAVISGGSILMKGMVPIITLAFFIPGMIFGKITGTIKDSKEMTKVLGQAMADMGPYVALSFIIAQFTSFFSWSNMGLIFAIKGANFLKASGFPIPVVIIILVLFTILIDIFLGSSSAKWAIFAPILVPMFMFMGYHPTFIQMVYRVGDAIINVVTPLIPYYGMMLAFGRKYDKNLQLGTLIATMFPYSMWFALAWIVQLLVWYFLKLPFGPGAPMMLP